MNLAGQDHPLIQSLEANEHRMANDPKILAKWQKAQKYERLTTMMHLAVAAAILTTALCWVFEQLRGG